MTKTFNDAATVKETSFGGDYDAQTKAVYDVLVKVQNKVVVTREDLSIDIDHNPPFEALPETRKVAALEQADRLLQHAREVSFDVSVDQIESALDILFETGDNKALAAHKTDFLTRDSLTIAYLFEALNKKAEDYQDWPEVGQFLFQCELSFRDYNQAVKRHHDYNDSGDCNNDRPDVIVH